MKIIRRDSSSSVYDIIFRHLETHEVKMIIWQIDPENRQRLIFSSSFVSYQGEIPSVNLKLLPGHKINPELPLYTYSEEGQIIFKSSILQYTLNSLMLQAPEELRILEGSDIDSIQNIVGKKISLKGKSDLLDIVLQQDMVARPLSERSNRDQDFLKNQFDSLTLDEEDKLFSQMRESPRTKPKVDKWLKIFIPDTPKILEVRIYDLSRGGISFITMDMDLFKLTTRLKVLSIDQFDLDDPLIAKVMSIRAVDELEIEYKIGCQFEEGQTG